MCLPGPSGSTLVFQVCILLSLFQGSRPQSIALQFRSIKSQDAVASEPADLRAIQTLIKNQPGGFEVLNTTVRQVRSIRSYRLSPIVVYCAVHSPRLIPGCSTLVGGLRATVPSKVRHACPTWHVRRPHSQSPRCPTGPSSPCWNLIHRMLVPRRTQERNSAKGSGSQKHPTPRLDPGRSAGAGGQAYPNH